MEEQRPNYDVVTSQLVIDEASRGDEDAISRRLAMLDGIPVLPANPDADTVADRLVAESLIPVSARVDAAHIASAALAGVQYLLTQNCKHIANATMRPLIEEVCREVGYEPVIICTPEELLEVK